VRFIHRIVRTTNVIRDAAKDDVVSSSRRQLMRLRFRPLPAESNSGENGLIDP
jgi:hypothetical protein